MIIESEKEIKNFKPEEYWSINAQFLKGKDTFQGKFYGIKGKKKELKNEKSVKEIIDQLTEEQFTIDKVNKRERKRNPRSEEHTSELQSRFDIVCRLLLEKKKGKKNNQN